MSHSFSRFCAVLLGLVTCLALAADPFKLEDIRIEGLQRVEPGTVLANLPFRVGDTYTDEKGAVAIRRLFDLGLFNDVKLTAEGNVIKVQVQERPTIALVDFLGTVEFDKQALSKSLTDIGLSIGRPYDKSLADRAEQELKRQYINKGYYSAQVVATVTPAEKNQVLLTFNVVEGDIAKISKVQINGASAFKQQELLELFNLTEPNWLTWYTRNDRYSQVKLNSDLEALKSFYLARGYLEFAVDSTQVTISPDKQKITISISITEGRRYVVSDIVMDGNFLGQDKPFQSAIKFSAGQVYNAELVTETVKAFQDLFGDFGYAFSRVTPVTDLDRASGLVKVSLRAEPGRRVYVRKIVLSGNSRTRDEVIRREFRQTEASWYDGQRVRLSRDRLNRLGYFTSVSIDPQEVAGTPDQVDLMVKVEEKPTGALQVGAGFSSAEKLFLSAGISQDNFFGSGNYLGVQINTSRYNTMYGIETTDPYFTKDGVSRTYFLNHKLSRPYTVDLGSYSLVTQSLGIKFGLPIAETDKIFVGVGTEMTEIRTGDNMPKTYTDYINDYGSKSRALPMTVGWSRDRRDSYLAPTKGYMSRINSDVSTFGDVKYARLTAQYQLYYPVAPKLTLGLNTELGYGKGMDNKPFPIFKNYFSGGLSSVRGYSQGSIGPTTTATNSATGATTTVYVGGSKMFLMNLEMITPMPGSGNDKTLRLFAFLDAGAAFSDAQTINFSDLRYSTGIGLSWISPVGPLKFGWAQPFNTKTGDKIDRIQFQIGSAF